METWYQFKLVLPYTLTIVLYACKGEHAYTKEHVKWFFQEKKREEIQAIVGEKAAVSHYSRGSLLFK